MSDAKVTDLTEKTTLDGTEVLYVVSGTDDRRATVANALKAGLSTATPQPIGTAAPGNGTLAAKDNHVHAHGNQSSDGNMHAAAVASGAAGFLTGADKALIDNAILRKNNYTATAAPAVGNDNTQGYGVGSEWIDTTNKKRYSCLDASTGAAIWQPTSAQVDVYTSSSGNWTKPAWATAIDVICIGGGGGGGGGRRGAAASIRTGGAGGGGAAISRMFNIPASSLGSTEAYAVGAAGTVGAAATSNDTNGGNGGVGGTSTFGTGTTRISAVGGNGGTGGNTGATTAGTGGTGEMAGGAGGVSNSSGGTAGAGNAASFGGAGGGGGGGGINGSDVIGAAAAGGARAFLWGAASGGAAGTSGGNGSAGAPTSATQFPGCGAGGGGGAASTSAAAGNGGNGGFYGGGGGGGGASVNGNNSGAGGLGGVGLVIVVSR
jgi:hypothetical protein